MRRLTRIEPPYLISLGRDVPAVEKLSRLPARISWPALFYLHKFVFGTRNPINVVTWTLEIEVTFYLLAPWLTRIYRMRGRGLRWALQLVLMGSYSYSVLRLALLRTARHG